MSHGEELKMIIEKIQDDVRTEGVPVFADGKGTVELLNRVYTFIYENAIDTDSIRDSMREYYEVRGLDLGELEELEQDEYAKIYDTFVGYKFNYFKDDLHSRRVLWTDDCCISMVHYLVRNNTIFCYFHLRSSDVVYKLFSDLNLIHRITRRLQDELRIYNTIIYCNAHSFHEIVLR